MQRPWTGTHSRRVRPTAVPGRGPVRPPWPLPVSTAQLLHSVQDQQSVAHPQPGPSGAPWPHSSGQGPQSSAWEPGVPGPRPRAQGRADSPGAGPGRPEQQAQGPGVRAVPRRPSSRFPSRSSAKNVPRPQVLQGRAQLQGQGLGEVCGPLCSHGTALGRLSGSAPSDSRPQSL